jgi:signal transduction histidine kinase/phage shock protein PspC (stress-responsive transcriptional regulator)
VSGLVASLRAPEGAVVAGVCARLGKRFGIDPLLLRIGFVVVALAGGGGILAYGILAVVLPADPGAIPRPANLRPGGPTWKVGAGVGLIALSLLLTLRAADIWFSDALVWPVVLSSAGLALLWRQSGMQARVAGNPRTLLGVGLIAVGGVVFLTETDSLGGLDNLALAAGVVFAGTALVFGPWWVRLSQALTAERAARIRSQERAEVAAHLHDSVLQTLALIQRRADDPREVSQLARRQERDLRAWLNEERVSAADSLAAALRATAAEVEALHGVPIEVVAVGDAPLDERVEALVAATREALLNAARFSGAERIDLFAEIAGSRAEVFVRDRGAGFDRAAVPEDRRGVRESIEGRMRRHGGSASVVTAPGAGTEVELVLDGVQAA